MKIESVLSKNSFPKVPMDDREVRWWIEQTVNECGYYDFDEAVMTIETLREKTANNTPPPMVDLLYTLLDRFGPNGMKFSPYFLACVAPFSQEVHSCTIYAWSIVQETLQKGSPICIRDFRHDFGPNGRVSDEAMKEIWAAQKIKRDPMFKTDNWLDLPSSWTWSTATA